jgi:hypothetical protein
MPRGSHAGYRCSRLEITMPTSNGDLDVSATATFVPIMRALVAVWPASVIGPAVPVLGDLAFNRAQWVRVEPGGY